LVIFESLKPHILFSSYFISLICYDIWILFRSNFQSLFLILHKIILHHASYSHLFLLIIHKKGKWEFETLNDHHESNHYASKFAKFKRHPEVFYSVEERRRGNDLVFLHEIFHLGVEGLFVVEVGSQGWYGRERHCKAVEDDEENLEENDDVQEHEHHEHELETEVYEQLGLVLDLHDFEQEKVFDDLDQRQEHEDEDHKHPKPHLDVEDEWVHETFNVGEKRVELGLLLVEGDDVGFGAYGAGRAAVHSHEGGEQLVDLLYAVPPAGLHLGLVQFLHHAVVQLLPELLLDRGQRALPVRNHHQLLPHLPQVLIVPAVSIPVQCS